MSSLRHALRAETQLFQTAGSTRAARGWMNEYLEGLGWVGAEGLYFPLIRFLRRASISSARGAEEKSRIMAQAIRNAVTSFPPVMKLWFSRVTGWV